MPDKRFAIIRSLGHSHAFCLVFVPLEYIPTIPPHFTYVIVFLGETIDVYIEGDICGNIICIMSKNTPVSQKQDKKQENDPMETTLFPITCHYSVNLQTVNITSIECNKQSFFSQGQFNKADCKFTTFSDPTILKCCSALNRMNLSV